MEKIKNIYNKGITLIALVITIVVLIILATVSITAMVGEEGLINRAQQATQYYSNADDAESDGLEGVTNYIDSILNGTNDNTIKDEEEEQDKKQQETIDSIKVLNERFKTYYMEYTADYKFDEFLNSGGAATQEEINQFVSTNLLDGQEINCKLDDEVFCTTFAVTNNENQTFFGRNLDKINDTPVLIVKVKPINGDYESVSIVQLGMLGDFKQGITEDMSEETKRQLLLVPYIPMDGMNEKGLSIAGLALNYKYPEQNTGKNQLNINTAIRLVLDKAANVNEAISLLEQYDMRFDDAKISGHYQIADSEGNSVVIEWINGKMEIIEKETDKEFQVCSNFYLSPSMTEDYELAGEDRYNTAYNNLNSTNGAIDMKGAMDILLAVCQDNSTKWSAVYNCTTQKIYILPYIKSATPEEVIEIQL